MEPPEQPATASACPDCAVQVRGLGKRFGDKLAVDGVDLDVPSGSVFASMVPTMLPRPSPQGASSRRCL